MGQLLTGSDDGLVTVVSGIPVRVEEFLGGGGQGEVYRASAGGTTVALKWYFPDSATPEQRDTVTSLVHQGAPSAAFVWPTDLVTSASSDGFGYVMPLRDDRLKGIVDLVKGRVRPRFSVLVRSCYLLASEFFELHAHGLCYRDISFGNVFFDPNTGDISIVDNDNVIVNNSSRLGVLGTPRFMAPEVVRGEAGPSADTDLYSLAVLMFYMLMIHHPLEGMRESAIHALDLSAMNQLYGLTPLFIFDPDDPSNRPDPIYHSNVLSLWPLYPQFLRDLFEQSFTVGLRDPHGRVTETEWRRALLRTFDSIAICGICGTENFYDLDRLRASAGVPPACWGCGTKTVFPPRLRIGSNIVVLNVDTRLYRHHLDPAHLFDLSDPVAEVSRHPTSPDIWGLKNLSPTQWVMIAANGTVREVGQGRSAQIADGTRINFGTCQGEIRVN